jgi:hypothetical protein
MSDDEGEEERELRARGRHQGAEALLQQSRRNCLT